MRLSLSVALLLAGSLQLHGVKLTDLFLEGASGIENMEASESRQPLMARLKPFFGKDLDEQLLTDLKGAIHAYYKEQGYPFAIAVIPQQDVSTGALKIKILEGMVGKISYKGNRWFSDHALSRYIHI